MLAWQRRALENQKVTPKLILRCEFWPQHPSSCLGSHQQLSSRIGEMLRSVAWPTHAVPPFTPSPLTNNYKEQRKIFWKPHFYLQAVSMDIDLGNRITTDIDILYLLWCNIFSLSKFKYMLFPVNNFKSPILLGEKKEMTVPREVI